MTSPLSPRRHRGACSFLATVGIFAGLAGVIYLFRADSHADPKTRISARAAVAGGSALAARNEVASPLGAPPVMDPRLVAQPPRAPAAPEAVTRAFPSITEAAADWRDFRPESLMVAPYPDLPLKFTRTALRDEGRYVTWIGRNPDLPGASFVGVATARGYDAILVMPGASQFSYHVRGAEVMVTESVPGEENCGVGPAPPPKVVEPGAAGAIIGISYGPGSLPVPDAFAETAPLTVDVLVAYDADMLAVATARSPDPVGYIDGQMKATLETCNLALSQSLVTAFAWRYLGAVAAPPYPRTGKLEDDLAAISPGGAIASWVKTTRFQRGADQVTLLVGGANNWGGYASSPKQVASAADFAVSVLKWGYSYKVFAHEWAHNFGCKHDRGHYTVNTPGGPAVAAPDSDGFYCYGHLWDNPPPPPGFSSGTTGDIMSYGDWIIPYFSNPNISVHVTGAMVERASSLELGTHQIGRAETDPKAAYNARVLNEQALAMSKLSEEIVMPAITQQPEGVSVQRGQSLSLSVKATGGGLVYQWLKGTSPVTGATAATYAKTAEDADAGAYSVTVSNFAGSVTSNSVTLAVTAPPPTSTPAAPSSGGGGGGGGAPSLWFLGLLGLGSFGRRRATRNATTA